MKAQGPAVTEADGRRGAGIAPLGGGRAGDDDDENDCGGGGGESEGGCD